MKNRQLNKHLNLIFLLFFLAVTLSINFLHADKGIAFNDDCPACHFLNSTFTTCQINFFHLPPPTIKGIVKASYSFNYKCIVFITPSSRSPPEA